MIVSIGGFSSELTSFVGRQREVADVKKMLSAWRLVTLTGVGGVGKTRLALRVAAARRQAFPGGVRLVELDRLHDEALVAQTVAGALGLQGRADCAPEALLAEHLADLRLLLVLDGCEHLIDAVAELTTALLRTCPRLRILATSREPLATLGERIVEVQPLATPGPDDRASLADLARFDSVALFLARARTATRDFRLTAENEGAVADLCYRLDGLPLAIELAAARIPAFSTQQILDRITDRFSVLAQGSGRAPERQRTLRACIGWSFELCTPPERQLWQRLSVFAGAFDLDAVEGVCADETLAVEDLFELTASLINKSIVVREEHDAIARYRLLESIRAYGAEGLREAGGEHTLRCRHRDWYDRETRQAHSEWISARQGEWLTRLAGEHQDIRAALEFSVTEPGEAAVALRMAADLHQYWLVFGFNTEGRRWLERALACPGGPTVDRVKAAFTASVLTALQGDLTAAAALVVDAEQTAAQLGDPFSHGVAKYCQAVRANYCCDDPAAAVAAIEEALGVFEAAGDLYWTVLCRAGLAMLNGFLGNVAAAGAYHQSVLALTEPRGEVYFRSYSLWSLGIGLWQQGQLDQAAACLEQALGLKSRIHETLGTAWCLEAMAWIAVHRNQPERAATLLGAAAALSKAMGNRPACWPALLASHDECERNTREALGDQAFEAAVVDGGTLTIDDAICYALDKRRTEEDRYKNRRDHSGATLHLVCSPSAGHTWRRHRRGNEGGGAPDGN